MSDKDIYSIFIKQSKKITVTLLKERGKMSNVKRYKAVITGSVQGVGFRIFACQKAEELGITGLVKNMADGTVYLEMQGEDSILTKFVDTLKKGNFIIKVESFNAKEISSVDEEKAFIIKY